MLQVVQSGDHDIPEEYLRRHPTGDGLSGRYIKQIMLLSECNARMSEMNTQHKAVHGVDLIETSEHRDAHGFAFHRLKPADVSPLTRSDVAADAARKCQLFDAGAPADKIFA